LLTWLQTTITHLLILRYGYCVEPVLDTGTVWSQS